MDHKKVDFKETNQFSDIFLHYLAGKSQLDSFYGNAPDIDNFADQIKSKHFSTEHRKVICSALKEQYASLEVTDLVTKNIDSLQQENTYTVTTGHQLNIFTGPLYFIYKIIAVINTCRQLAEKYPDKNFVPVYWMASEDHDFEEIAHFRLNGKKHVWSTEQQGAVGRFNPKELKEILDQVPGIPEFFRTAYLKNKTLADAARAYVNRLFGEYGLVVFDGDNPEVKQLFTKVVKDDLTTHTANALVEEQSSKLNELGYKTQVFPREINFFYLDEGLRCRIIKEGEFYNVLDTDLSFSEDEMLDLLNTNPEKFSPNVILRPLYQEMVLPNLAYFGGPAEVAYWLQLKPVFDHYKIAFPIVMPRNFAMVIPQFVQNKMEKSGLSMDLLFEKRHNLIKQITEQYATHNIQLNGQQDAIMDVFNKIKTQANEVDPTLIQHVEAQQTITKNKLENIQKKFIRAEKRHQQDRLRQVEEVLDYLYPNGSPQERVDNFLNFYQMDAGFIDNLVGCFDPFDYSYNILLLD